MSDGNSMYDWDGICFSVSHRVVKSGHYYFSNITIIDAQGFECYPAFPGTSPVAPHDKLVRKNSAMGPELHVYGETSVFIGPYVSFGLFVETCHQPGGDLACHTQQRDSQPLWIFRAIPYLPLDYFPKSGRDVGS